MQFIMERRRDLQGEISNLKSVSNVKEASSSGVNLHFRFNAASVFTRYTSDVLKKNMMKITLYVQNTQSSYLLPTDLQFSNLTLQSLSALQ